MRMLLISGLVVTLASSAWAVTSQATAFAVPVTNDVVVVISTYGELTELAGCGGAVTYDPRGRITQVGSLTITYDARARVSTIGASTITYDPKSRVSSLGAYAVKYDPRSRVKAIGPAAISYDPKSRISDVVGGARIGIVIKYSL